jgi:hypothetical protein
VPKLLSSAAGPVEAGLRVAFLLVVLDCEQVESRPGVGLEELEAPDD